jgi:hypothetical protein
VTTKYEHYSRRALLSRLGGAAAVATLTPFLPPTEAEAAVAKTPRYLYIYTPVAPSSRHMDPMVPVTNQGEITDINFRGDLVALNTMKTKLSFYRGMTNVAGDASNLGGGHRGRAFPFLVGVPVQAGKVGAGSPIEGNNGLDEKPSIDQFIADQLITKGIKTPLRDLRFGWCFDQVDSLDSVSFRAGKKQFYQDSALKVFNAIFAVSGGSGSTTNTDPALVRRKSVLDAVYKDLNRMKPQLSSVDGKRLDQHLTAIAELQDEITRSQTGGGGGSCSISTADQNLKDTKGYADQSKAFARLAAVAFNCDLTRVMGSAYGHPYDAIKDFSLDTVTDGLSNWHQATHGLGGTQAKLDTFISAVMKYRASVYLEFLKQLDSFNDPNGGTLLDSTIVHWFMESISDHKYQDCFNVIGGGAGVFKMGKQFIVGGTTNTNKNAPLNMLLSTIGQTMGVIAPGGQFGNYSGSLAAKYLA